MGKNLKTYRLKMNALNVMMLNFFILFLLLNISDVNVNSNTLTKTLIQNKNLNTPNKSESEFKKLKVNFKTESEIYKKKNTLKEIKGQIPEKNLTENNFINKNLTNLIQIHNQTKTENLKKSKVNRESPSLFENFNKFLKFHLDKIDKKRKNFDSRSFKQKFIYNHYKVEKCDEDACPSDKGFCSKSKKKCICNPNTLNYYRKDPFNMKIHRSFREDLCGYSQKKIIYAMILEILIPFGLGHLYAKRYLFAFIKFISFIIIPLLIIAIFGLDIIDNIKKTLDKFKRDFRLTKIKNEEEKFRVMEYLKKFIFLLILISFISSYITDLLFFGLGVYKDGNGFDLV